MKRKSKLLAAAIALLGFSAAASVTGTVAWFTAANTVSVSNMSIQAQVEEGIVIANETHTAASHWKDSAEASHTGKYTEDSVEKQYSFVPTSIDSSVKWYHANSSRVDDPTASAALTELTVTTTDGIGSATIGSGIKNIFLKNSFFIQASDATTTINNQDIYITELAATGTTSSTELDKALRAAIVYNGNVTVLGIVPGFGNYAGSPAIAPQNASGTNKIDVASNVTIHPYTVGGTNALQLDVYLYFEGCDSACMNVNIPSATLDTLGVSFKFGNELHA